MVMRNPGRKDPKECEWPAALREATGTPFAVTRLAGVGGPGSFRVEGPRATVIYKRGVPPRELAWYRRCAPHAAGLAAAGCRTAPLVASGHDPDPWLALGWAGPPLPRERWGTPLVLAALASWHRAAALWEGPLGDAYPFAWDDGLTRDALEVLAAPDRLAVRDGWGRAAEEAQRELFAPPGHAIHGDPNPTNWLLAADAEESPLVLVDWGDPGGPTRPWTWPLRSRGCPRMTEPPRPPSGTFMPGRICANGTGEHGRGGSCWLNCGPSSNFWPWPPGGRSRRRPDRRWRSCGRTCRGGVTNRRAADPGIACDGGGLAGRRDARVSRRTCATDGLRCTVGRHVRHRRPSRRGGNDHPMRPVSTAPKGAMQV